MKIGDKVAMTGKYYVPDKHRASIFTVVDGPRDICGTPCVWLEGYPGCYAVDGLRQVAKEGDK